MSNQSNKFFSHETLEKNIGLLIAMTLVVVSIAGLVQILPLFFQHSTTEPVKGIAPYSPLRLAGRDIYIREGCVGCHSQQVRTLRAETERYGHYSLAGESVFDHPFLWGSKRTGPDLARVGQRYSDDWHRIHLRDPREVVPESNMPAYAWLSKTPLDNSDIEKKMHVLRQLGVPYTDAQIAGAREQLAGKTEEDAVVAYLQGLGVELRNVPDVAAAPAAAPVSSSPAVSSRIGGFSPRMSGGTTTSVCVSACWVVSSVAAGGCSISAGAWESSGWVAARPSILLSDAASTGASCTGSDAASGEPLFLIFCHVMSSTPWLICRTFVSCGGEPFNPAFASSSACSCGASRTVSLVRFFFAGVRRSFASDFSESIS